MKYNWVFNHLLKNRKSAHPCIIGIDGLSRSGKTTFVRHFENELNQQSVRYITFHIDDHIVERRRRYNTGNEEWVEYYYLQWDIEWLKNNFFKKMKKQTRLQLPYYNQLDDVQVLQSVDIGEVEFIIVEGVFLQREEWRPAFDTVLFLDCNKERRFARENERTRKEIEKFQNRYWKAEEHYIRKVNPLDQADLIVQS
ncbi:kinase [Pseudalkalibacillus hwajinpoensis]|uniref:Phosphoribulokinase/uridine kinase domain-containing protein n=1 Tax=Guptibacillus hwajinpoensis TaxID=208199 RepID=A0A4U1MKW6_9BACL|nr:kinase [Pseudalkalibacillus hwajinpoensis]TKD71255.1 hypothetical protein FBF83_00130 [Pseudalkalibacillus hwajinpoensis]